MHSHKIKKHAWIIALVAMLGIFFVYQMVQAAYQGIWPSAGAPLEVTIADSGLLTEGNQIMTKASDGDYIFAYSGGSRLYMQKFSETDGSAVALWNSGNPTLVASASPLAIVPDASGGAWVAWNNDLGGGDCDVYVNLVDFRGALQLGGGAEMSVLAGGACQVFMDMIPDGTGGIYIAWGNGTSFNRRSTSDLYITQLTSIGPPAGWNTGAPGLKEVSFPETAGGAADSNARIVRTTTGDIIALYESGGFYTLATSEFSSTGAINWGAVTIDSEVAQNYDIAASTGGSAVITYVDDPWGTPDLETQRINGAGGLDWGTGTVVSTVGIPTTYNQPRLVSDGLGGAIIVWFDESGNWDTYAHHVLTGGAMDTTGGWSGGRLLTSDLADGNTDTILNYFGKTPVVADSSGGAYIMQASYVPPEGWQRVHLQHVQIDGTVDMGTDGTLVSSARTPIFGSIISDGSDGAIVAFQQGPSGGDIYAQYFDDYTAAPEVGMSGGGSSCTIYPQRLDLPPTLNVLNQDGRPVVELNWAEARVNDAEATDKVRILLDYLGQRVPPKLDGTDKPLASIFSRHMYKQIYSSNNRNLVAAFESQLKTHVSRTRNLTFQQVQEAVVNDDVCNEDVSSVMIDAIKKLAVNSNTKDATEVIILNFIKELLSVEGHLSDATFYKDSFTDYFNTHYSPVSSNTYNDLTLKIFRDGKQIYTVENPAFTSYIDEAVPVNTTKRAKTHNYYLVTETVCAQKIGSAGKAQISPQLTPGTDIDVDADIKVKIKSGYDILFMEKLQALVEAAKIKNRKSIGLGQDPVSGTNNTLSCLEAASNLTEANLNSNNIMNYILACHGSAELSSKLQAKKLKIIPPLLMTLRRSHTENAISVIDKYIEPVIVELIEEVGSDEEVFGLVDGSLARLDLSLGIPGFDEEDKERIACAGILGCSEERKNIVTTYFRGGSHSADLSVEVYDESGELKYETTAKTNIFGEVENLGLGQFLSGAPYSIKVRLIGQNFVLPKVSLVTLDSAEPKSGGGFKAHLDLAYSHQFRYGNFDESNDNIDTNDILAWAKLIIEQPELWNDSNLDGLYGVDLLDVLTFQQNWGKIQESRLEESQISIMELASIFGLVTGLETKIQVPTWLNLLELSCSN